jgi:hypothetical protein
MEHAGPPSRSETQAVVRRAADRDGRLAGTRCTSACGLRTVRRSRRSRAARPWMGWGYTARVQRLWRNW